MGLQNSNRGIGIACVALAAFCWGVAGGISGILMANGWSPSIITLYRGGIGFVIMSCWLLLRGGSARGQDHVRDRRLWPWSVVAGLGVAGNFLFYAMSIDRGSVSVATTLMYCAPIYVYVAALAVGMETASTGKFVAILVIIAGIALLTELYNPTALNITTAGIVAGLLSGICYAVFIFGFKCASRFGAPQAILTVAFGVLLLGVAGVGSLSDPAKPMRSPDWTLFLALGVLGAGLSFLIYVVGMRGTSPTIAAITAMIEPVTASLFGVLLLDERLDISQLAGMVLILLAVTRLAYPGSTPAKRH